MHVFAQNAVNIGVFEEVVQKHCKNTAFWTCCVVKMSQIAVFLLRWLFCKNIVNTNVLARFWGSEGEKTL